MLGWLNYVTDGELNIEMLWKLYDWQIFTDEELWLTKSYLNFWIWFCSRFSCKSAEWSQHYFLVFSKKRCGTNENNRTLKGSIKGIVRLSDFNKAKEAVIICSEWVLSDFQEKRFGRCKWHSDELIEYILITSLEDQFWITF